ncbi:MAG: flagellar hook-associated protein FlgK [Bacillota bacterium]
MSSIFMGFNTAIRGMKAQQIALDVTGHNIANANTPGFSRQQAELATTPPFSAPTFGRNGTVGQIGTGVDVTEIKRVRDNFLDSQIRGEVSSLGYWENRQDVVSQVENIFPEPTDTGLNQLLGEFWDGWQELSKNAESSPARTILVEKAATLADAFRHTSKQLETLHNDLNQQLELKVKDVNSLGRQIADLNQQITNVKVSGDQPNDLMDRRDILLDQLSDLTGYTLHQNEDGAVAVIVGGKSLVQGTSVNELKVAQKDGVLVPVWSSDNSSFALTSGQLEGIITSRDVVLSKYQKDLNTLATGMIAAVNTVHSNGYDLARDLTAGEKDVPFFTGTDAGNIEVNEELRNDVSKIAAASDKNNSGDGGNALLVAQLRNTLLKYDDSTGTLDLSPAGEGGTTFDNYYKDLIATLGVTGQESNRMVTNQQALVDSLNNRKESISGVSLDEEMANMILYQHAYQASAKMITTLDDLLDTVINRMG